MTEVQPAVPTQRVPIPEIREAGVSLFVRREDLLHPLISGNKFRKLKYNLLQAEKEGYKTLLTFGGAYSNHIAAVAQAGKEYGFNTIGIIRGAEIARKYQDNPTLAGAAANGMHLEFISREAYRLKSTTTFLEKLKREHGPFYHLPEGGTNTLAIKGCEEILTAGDRHFDVVCCCAGTGGTLAGLIRSSEAHQMVIGFPALKGDFIKKDICSFVHKKNWKLENSYHFGGYGKIDAKLVRFMNEFRHDTGIPLDPVYTAKMFYGILDMISKNRFHPGSRILAIHTGGLQGSNGMNQLLNKKQLPLINL